MPTNIRLHTGGSRVVTESVEEVTKALNETTKPSDWVTFTRADGEKIGIQPAQVKGISGIAKAN